jgi:hypothetical protein
MFRHTVHHERVGLVNVSVTLEQIANAQAQAGWELVTFTVSDNGDDSADLYIVFRLPRD